MNSDDLQAIRGLVGAFGLGAVVAAGVAFLVAKFYISSYLAEKGRNLATREDIAGITDNIESVRAQYATLIEELKARHQLRLAAVDRRLQAHQEAFTCWRRLMAVTHTNEVGIVVNECQDWWENNCIYLEPKVRESFLQAYSAAGNHNQLVRDRAEAEVVKANWSLITGFPNTLFQAVQLPALSELEAKILGVNNEPTVQRNA